MKKIILLSLLLALAVGVRAQEHLIPQPYNAEISLYVELFANRRQGLTNLMLQRSYLYFPLMEKSLEHYGIPQWMKFLPMVESTLNSHAKSRNGRMGLWQLSAAQAARNGLLVNDEVNECYDPELAAEAACGCLQELHARYDDWLLAIAAYNTSPTIVDHAIAKAGGSRNYWAIHRLLPREAQGFVPALLAISYVMKHPDEYGLKLMGSAHVWAQTETIIVTDSLSFSQISSAVGIPVEELVLLNPKYVNRWIPASMRAWQTLRLPGKYASLFKQAFRCYASAQPVSVERQVCFLKHFTHLPNVVCDLDITLDIPVSGPQRLRDSITDFFNRQLYRFFDDGEHCHLPYGRVYSANPRGLAERYREAYRPFFLEDSTEIHEFYTDCLMLKLVAQTYVYVTYEIDYLFFGEGLEVGTDWVTFVKSDGHRLTEIVSDENMMRFYEEHPELRNEEIWDYVQWELSLGNDSWVGSAGLLNDSVAYQFIFAQGIYEDLMYPLEVLKPYLSEEAREVLVGPD